MAINALDQKLNEMLASREAFTKHFTRADLEDYIDYLINNHRVVITATSNLNERITAKLAEMLTDTRLANKMGLGPYIDFRKRLTKTASSMEMTRSTKALLAANTNMIKLLDEITRSIGDLFSEDRINLFNMHVSHVILVGIFYQSEVLIKYTKYTMAALSMAVAEDGNSIPKYRTVYLTEHSDKVAATVNALINGAGSTNYKGMIHNISVNAADFSLIDEDGNSNMPKIRDAKIKGDTSTVLNFGVSHLNIFRLIGERKNSRKEWKARERQAEEEWLRAHTDLLIAKLEGMDPESKEYKKLQAIIARYEKMITSAERKRNKGK